MKRTSGAARSSNLPLERRRGPAVARLALSVCLALGAIGVVSCNSCPSGPCKQEPQMDLNELAERYVRLVLAVGTHDANYIDAYFGPESWREEAEAEGASLDTLRTRAERLLGALPGEASTGDPLLDLRIVYLRKQLNAVVFRIRQLEGAQFSFDQEALQLYDAVPPSFSEAHFDSLVARLDEQLPGHGSTADRLEQFRAAFVIPPDRIESVFQAAIEEARRRTLAHLELPDDEVFELEFVTDKPWSGYNWYQGSARSLIQINTELPIFIDRAVDLAAHEGYPGHHVYNLLLEQRLAREHGWPEFQVYVLFSPQSLIAEGTANFGIEVAFPAGDRVAFERAVLFPLAGLDPSTADRYYEVQELVSKLAYAGNEAARSYLDGAIDADSAAAYLTRYALMEPERARQRVRFIETYRSYVINYNVGLDLVRHYVDGKGGTSDQPERRWEVFGELLASPRMPSGL